MPLEHNFEKFIKEHHLLSPQNHVLLAVSGGIDSMAMLYLFHHIQQPWQLTLTVVHINHSLRGNESDGDELFVKNVAENLGIPFYSQRVDVKTYANSKKISTQVAARVLRYNALESFRRRIGANVIATAHQANDNAETVMLNLIRGTGIRGLAGIPVHNKGQYTIRPILFATRKDIESYTAEQNIQYRNDSSNTSLKYKRNFIRSIVFPELNRKYHLDCVSFFNSIASQMNSVAQQLDEYISSIMPSLLEKTNDKCIIHLSKLQNQPPFIQDEILAQVLRMMNIEPTEHRICALSNLASLQAGKIITLSHCATAVKDRNTIIIEQRQEPLPSIEIEIGKEYTFPGFTFASKSLHFIPDYRKSNTNIAYIDASKLGRHLILRQWHDGDRFIPLGMSRPKKLSDFFTDLKLPRSEKSQTPIFESDGTIVWICGKRIDERFKITPSTQECIQLTYKKGG